MEVLWNALFAAFVISLLSLVGVFVVGVQKKRLDTILFLMVSFSAGSLLGGAFFHLLPEALEKSQSLDVFKVAIIGFVLFFLIERVLRWHHCHEVGCETHKIIGYQNLIGDSVHNFIDGLVLVSSFYVDFNLGIAVTFSVMLHEIPQEIGDFGVLLYSGFSKTKALVYNLFAALFSLFGVVLGYLLIERVSLIVDLLLPFAAGGFLYIAASDLIPELHKETKISKSLTASLFFVLALLLMLFLKD